MSNMAQKKKRVFGSKKYGGLSRYGPQQLAVAVIDHYRQWDPDRSVTNWVGGIESYQNDPERVKQAQLALASWYMALNEVRADIRRAYEKAKDIRASYNEEQILNYAPVPAPAQVLTAPTRRRPVTQEVIVEE